jgi:CheY-like chemotaxis protein
MTAGLRASNREGCTRWGGAALSALKRVLVADDDDGIRMAVADALAFEGYEVITATNGAEALEQVRSARPDAIVLDLMMPVMDGWQFMEACRNEKVCERTPVLVMSAYRHLGTTAPSLAANACIAKPFDLDVLLGAVERLVRSWPGPTEEVLVALVGRPAAAPVAG